MTDGLDALVAALAEAETVVALTGAGVSTASGIPDFRGEDGLWTEYDPAEFHYSRFKRDPAGFWERRVAMHEDVFADGEVVPNPAHEALAAMENAGRLDTLITQNIDGLHQAAGSESVIELHGSAERVACEDCGGRYPADPVRERVLSGEMPPLCPDCESVLKPDVVLFGEQLPAGALQAARDAADRASVFLAIGSSLAVEPAASLPRIADRRGATVAVINLEETSATEFAAIDLLEDVTVALPRLAEKVC